jgi:hypothetical protein
MYALDRIVAFILKYCFVYRFFFSWIKIYACALTCYHQCTRSTTGKKNYLIKAKMFLDKEKKERK